MKATNKTKGVNKTKLFLPSFFNWNEVLFTWQELLQPGTISTDTIMVLVNAIYFKGFWKEQFLRNMTEKE